MIHKFAINGVKIVLDVYSGAVHVVDNLAWEMIDDYQEMTASQLIGKYSHQFSPEEVASVLGEINGLVQEGLLYSPDPFPDGYQMPQREKVKALCLNVAHLCNLRCRYCFAEQGKFGGNSQLMPLEVGLAALDFLVKESGLYRMLQVDFFGGEPLLNFKVLKELVFYGQKLARSAGKEINFTVTTNAVLLNKEVGDFLNENNIYVILSIDGRPEVHDRMRSGPGNSSSYCTVLKNITRFVESRGGSDYYLRGTYTRFNLDFSNDIKHFINKGFRYLSLEPVVTSETEDYALTFEDLPMLMNQYEQLARLIVNLNRAGQEVSFFHYNIDLEGGPCLLKRISACGAGCEYLAVSPEGDIYPCHQFVGKRVFLMGNVFKKGLNEEIRELFRNAHIYNKEECRCCWARFYCGGGCHASAYTHNGDFYKPYKLGCILMQKRLECALYIKACLGGQQ